MGTIRRLSVYQAAEVLGVTVDAVRGRIKRDTIKHVREGNRVYVILDADQYPTGHDQPTDQYGESSTLISQLRDENAYLREESRRKDEIIVQLAATMRQLSAAPPEEPPGAPETVEEGPEGGAPQSGTPGPQEGAQRRSWWRRMFGE